MLFRSKASLLDEIADLTVQHTACLAELAAERKRADTAEQRAEKALAWHNDWCVPDKALAEAARADLAEAAHGILAHALTTLGGALREAEERADTAEGNLARQVADLYGTRGLDCYDAACPGPHNGGTA